VAPLAVKAIIRTYNEHFKGTDLDYVKDKIRHWEAVKSDAERVIKAREKEIDDHINDARFGVDNLTPLIQAKLQEQTILERDVLRYKHQLETLRGGKAPELSIEDLARIDDQMNRKVAERDRIRAELSQKRLTYGDQHPTIQLLLKQQQAVELDIDKTANDFRAKWVLSNRMAPLGEAGGGNNPGLIARDPAELELMVDIAEKNAVNNRKETEKLGYLQRQIDKAKAAIVDQNEKLKEANRELEKLRFQQESIGDVTIISEGNSPTLAIDNRIKFGLLGFMAGGGLPVALLLLVGLMDRRYRYSDEPGVDVTGITLLGILPNLPDRLSDPEQAAIAAHCVHQIRTMLQINGSTLGTGGTAADEMAERRVFAVTSASPGDGKTSLTLALGLSYAACGTQTLLIDCDLVGGGLTSRMNVNASEGVLEAIADRALLSYVRTTDIADVSILPVGGARGHHASTLSPGALRRLIDEAKKHFEVILIDTGPILGSIEASLVCAAADGVVLTVARGQQRPMVEKALSHLAAIGARLAGVVFNRAQTSDFERSISGMSIRSISRHPANGNGNGHSAGNGHGRYGPVAKAVAAEQD
jgi:capsular exopolysaccharide synthesis family protein